MHNLHKDEIFIIPFGLKLVMIKDMLTGPLFVVVSAIFFFSFSCFMDVTMYKNMDFFSAFLLVRLCVRLAAWQWTTLEINFVIPPV